MMVEIDREDDGSWIAEVPDLPGVMTYGKSRDEAIAKLKAWLLGGLPTDWIMERKYRN